MNEKREPLLRGEDITVTFGGLTALNHVSLEIYPGEIMAIIGPNGAGKTTLLNVISGFYKADEGRVFFEGKALAKKMKPNRIAALGIARTFQNLALFRGMPALGNIMVGRTIKMKSNIFSQAVYWRMSEKEEIRHRRAVEGIIDFLQIENIRKTPASMLPYGLQKRVELARALAAEPKLLLLDEPMAGMNLEEKEDIARFVLDANEELGYTIALIEHDMGVVMDICDRMVVLDFGNKIAEGTPNEIKSNPKVIQAYLGRQEGNP
jgi:branched-chain amino acid transport system ATP-binding protein